MTLGTHIVERAFAEWLLTRADVEELVRVRQFLRVEDFLDERYAAVYAVALEALDAHRGSGRSSDALSSTELQARVVTSDDFLRSMHAAGAAAEPLIPALTPAVAAPRDWARHIVEDAARRRVQALSFRVRAALNAREPFEELELVRRQLDALMVQLELANVRVGGLAQRVGVSRLPKWRDELPPLDRAGPGVTAETVPGEAEMRRIGGLTTALLLQQPGLAAELVRGGEIGPADLIPSEVYVAILTAAGELVRDGSPLELPSLFRRVEKNLVAAGRTASRGREMIETEDILAALRSAQAADLPPEPSPVRRQIHHFVARVRTNDAAELMRDVAFDPDLTTTQVVSEARGSLHRARTAVRRLPASPLVPVSPPPPPRARGDTAAPPSPDR